MGLKSEEPFLTVVRERDVLMEAGSERCYVANFEDRGKGQNSRRDAWVAPRSWKGKEMYCTSEIREKNASC